MEKLKTFRVVFSLSFFILCTLLFVDLWHFIPPTLITLFVSLQIIPSITKALVVQGISIVGLIFVFVITLLFGRVYCSTICPVGTLQDVIIHVERKLQRRKKAKYRAPFFALQYLLLCISAFLIFLGSISVLEIIEPYSNYGRMIVNFAVPVVTLMNNSISSLLTLMHIYTLYTLPVRPMAISSCFLSVMFLCVVGYMAYSHGRLFCNSLCPAGAVVGLLSRFSLFRIVIDENSCNECGKCERACKANCIESSSIRIEYSACINCFNCLDSCPTDAVRYRPIHGFVPVISMIKFDASRRSFFKQISTPFIGGSLLTLIRADDGLARSSGYDENKKIPVTPPGSKSISHFSQYCTACYLCVSACPSHVLVPSFLDYGMTGLFQPKMDYAASYCNYDCVACGEVCPSGAIFPLDAIEKKQVQIGKSVFVKDDCVVVKKKKDCAACSEHCPTKAVHMVPYEGTLVLPEVNNDVCVGCGACEHACPTTPRKAIYVKSNAFHAKAKKPEPSTSKLPEAGIHDFPF